MVLPLSGFAQQGVDEPIPSTKPNKYQKQQIKRKYGMFIHFGLIRFIMKSGLMVPNWLLPMFPQQ